MKTKFTELLGIEYPIIQGAMAWVSDGELAAAVSEAGGAGTIAPAGIQMGTRFYASKECNAHIKAKQKIVDSNDTDTVVTGLIHGHPVRGIRNEMSDKYLKLEKEGASDYELEELVVGSSRTAPQEGDIEWGFVQAGQSLSAIKEIKSCAEIVQQIIKEAEARLS